MTPSNSQIAALGAEFDAATAHAQKLLGNAGFEQMVRRPHPQSWLPAECIAHLSITTRDISHFWIGRLQMQTAIKSSGMGHFAWT
jgi:hypothetical protein